MQRGHESVAATFTLWLLSGRTTLMQSDERIDEHESNRSQWTETQLSFPNILHIKAAIMTIFDLNYGSKDYAYVKGELSPQNCSSFHLYGASFNSLYAT